MRFNSIGPTARISLKTDAGTEHLAERIASLIEESRKRVVAQVNSAMVHTYFEIGRIIVENEQNGEARASYGKGLLKELSHRLTARFGKGFSVDNLENMRRFYLTYSSPISETLSRKSESSMNPAYEGFALSWSHYLFLMRIDDPNERSFYEREES